ncbi:MAG: FtsH protease activity modulator HflK [Arenicellales bacterium WSBS_2016_MAG_OTU3]
MPWNQPGSGNNGQDPWGQNNGNNPGNSGNRGNRQGPPDLDEILQNIQNKISGILGGNKGGGRTGGGSSSGGSGLPSFATIGLIVLLVIGFISFNSFYTVQEGEQAVVLRLGKYLETKDAGLRWNIPYVDEVEKVDVQKINTVEVGYRSNARTRQNANLAREALMLTSDENIIDIQFAVQYDIKDPRDLVFFVSERDFSDGVDNVVRQATESAVREVIGGNTMDFAITEGRAEIAARTKVLLQAILDRYETGINVQAVEMQNAQPPLEVKDAFDDAVRAREDEERLKNEAEAYANDIIPRARGRSSRILQEAEAYKESSIAKATGQASRFTQVLTEYKLAPDITRDRLYLETMEQVMSNSSKLMIDQDGGNSLFYLPLDQIIKGAATGSDKSTSTRNQSIADDLDDIGVSRSGRSGRTSRGQ